MMIYPISRQQMSSARPRSDKSVTEDVIAGEGVLKPVEAMAEAALALCTSDRDGLNGKVYKSLTLLERLGLPVRTLDGKTLL
jgi:citronellol/citronellal dehydrogenase